MPDNKLQEYLDKFLTDNRKQKINSVVSERTRYITVVLEDIFHPPNASAVIRNCECFGIQDLHIIENEKEFQANTEVVKGAAQWVNLHHYREQANNTKECLVKLKKAGYRIVATTLNKDLKQSTLDNIELDQPMALCFGCEETGLSQTAHDLADNFITLPMYGFTQSFNISVTSALCLQELIKRLRASDQPWKLSEKEQDTLKLNWTQKSIKNVEKIIERFQNT
jgi:tRNA (guanosine-2'-O-)-methyltransferase